MLPFRKILFPVDYSAPCQAVIPYVQEMAERFSAELTAVYAYAPSAAISHSELLLIDPELQTKVHALEEDRLKQFVCRFFPSQQVECFAQLGEPGSVINGLVRQQRADLVMLATRGHGPVRRLLLGSVTAKVLHDVSAAVWTGVGAALADHPVRIPYQSIVCALDDGDEAAAVLKAASAISSAYHAQLSILHVVQAPLSSPEIDVRAYTQKLIDRAQLGIRELKAKVGVDAPHTVVEALVAERIHQEVVRRKADLLVTGRGHAMGTISRLWSHLYSVIRDSPCPVISI
jgi:nucleotide-binding universal stress UspA family protein